MGLTRKPSVGADFGGFVVSPMTFKELFLSFADLLRYHSFRLLSSVSGQYWRFYSI